MIQIPDHPVIRAMERGGFPETPHVPPPVAWRRAAHSGVRRYPRVGTRPGAADGRAHERA